MNAHEYSQQESSNSNLLDVPKEDNSGITPTNNVSPPTKDTSVINAPHVKPKRRMSLGKSPRRSLGAEFETSNLLAHSRILRDKHDRALAEMRVDPDELDNSDSRHSEGTICTLLFILDVIREQKKVRSRFPCRSCPHKGK
jgi:hypothetical protein